MSVVERQIKKIIADETIKVLQGGRVIDLTELFRIISIKIRQLRGGPTLQYRTQSRRSKFVLDAYNKSIDEIKFDLEILYDSFVETLSDLFKIYNLADVSYKAQRTQLTEIRGIVNNLLFTTRNADDYFYGVFDSFNDLSKVDLTRTTKGIVDLSEKAALLPFNKPSAIRVPMDHLMKVSNYSVLVSGDKANILSQRNGGGSIFGHAFTDISSIWRYEVLSKVNTGAEMSFTIPTRGDEGLSVITRVELTTISGNPTVARVLHSLDKINFTRFIAGEDKRITTDNLTVAWDFPETTVRYIRIILIKEEPDAQVSGDQADSTITNPSIASQNQPTQSNPLSSFGLSSQNIGQSSVWLYNFNIANIGMYKMGRTREALLVSRPLIPDKSRNKIPIDKVSLITEDIIPPKTSIDYFIGLSDSNGNPKTDMLPISPSNYPKIDRPSVITFGNNIKESIPFVATASTIRSNDPNPPIIKHKKIDFYPIRELTTTDSYIYGTTKLYRGGGVFSRQTSMPEVIKSVRDNFIDFSDGQRSKELYAEKTETAQHIVRSFSGGNSIASFLRVGSKIVRAPLLVPELGVDPSTDPEPNYSLYRILHVRQEMKIRAQKIAPSSTGIISGTNIPVSQTWSAVSSNGSSIGVPILLNGQPIDIISEGSDAPILRYNKSGFQFIFRPGIDYVIKKFDYDDPSNYFVVNFSWGSSIPKHWRIIPTEPVYINILSGSNLTGQFGGTGQFLLTGGLFPPSSIGGVVQSPTEEIEIDYTIDPDITSRVQNIDYDSNEIQLDGQLQIMESDFIQVSYRARPTRIIRDTIKTTSNFGEASPGTVYQEGTDYTIDINNGTITKLMGGRIGNNSTDIVYVDYSYREIGLQVETFSIWGYVESREPIRFDYSDLNLKTKSGESILWTYVESEKDSTQDITSRNTMTLTRGWHFFVVRSLRPELFSDAAIHKILKMRSVEGNYLFLRRDRGGMFFDKITAFRNPMRQVNLAFLRGSTLKDNREVFALDSSNRIYVNFPPGETEELYMRRVTSTGVIATQTEEEFIFEASKKTAGNIEEGSADHIILHALLNRAEDSSGGVTPKLLSYNIRVNY